MEIAQEVLRTDVRCIHDAVYTRCRNALQDADAADEANRARGYKNIEFSILVTLCSVTD